MMVATTLRRGRQCPLDVGSRFHQAAGCARGNIHNALLADPIIDSDATAGLAPSPRATTLATTAVKGVTMVSHGTTALTTLLMRLGVGIQVVMLATVLTGRDLVIYASEY